jgi:hypothetical protein
MSDTIQIIYPSDGCPKLGEVVNVWKWNVGTTKDSGQAHFLKVQSILKILILENCAWIESDKVSWKIPIFGQDKLDEFAGTLGYKDWSEFRSVIKKTAFHGFLISCK